MGGVFGLVFAGIGVTVIVFMWTSRGFGEPPLVAKVIASFISLAFIAMGGLMLVSAVRAPGAGVVKAAADAPAVPGAGYACPSCGGRLGAEADISPKGDVKCGYCRKWFNIHS